MDSGQALVAPKTSVGYLRQTAVSGSIRTVYDEASSQMKSIVDAKVRLVEAEKMMEGGDVSEAALEEFDRASKGFADVGGWTQAQDVDSVLKGLGFEPEDSERLCSEFSGGWQMRIALARLLLSKPNVLLLDEPSNHLDSSARDWLGKYLASFPGSLVLVSHDLSLLATSVNNIAEISSGSLLTYISCDYDRYLTEKVFRAKSAQAEYDRNVAEADRLQAYVDKWGASATKATSAQSRVKMIEKMRKEGKLTPPPEAVVSKAWKPSIELPDPPKARGEILLGLEGADVGYGVEGGDDALLKDVSIELLRGMKIILRGPNGAGKSTLVAALRGDLPLMDGTRVENERLRLGSFTQDLAQQLDTKARAVDLVTAHARGGAHGDFSVSDEAARGAMGRLGLTGDKPLRKVGQLSGGEKARVALSMFALKASNVLILDEPSNHLDVECIGALSSALSSWGGKDGAIVVVSHDRSFCEEVGFTHVGTVDNGSITIEQRDLNDEDWSQYDMNSKYRATTSLEDGLKHVELTPEEKEEAKRRQKKAFNAPKRIQKLENMIETAEGRVADIDGEMMEAGADLSRLTDLQSEKDVEEAKIAEMMGEWEELESLLVEVSS